MGTGRCGSFEEYSRKCSSAPEAQEEISRWRNPKVSTQLCKPFVYNNEFLDLNAVSPLKTTSVKRCVDALGRNHRNIGAKTLPALKGRQTKVSVRAPSSARVPVTSGTGGFYTG